MQQPLSLELALRYLRGDRSRLLLGTSRSALGSTGLGVAAMVVAMALMTGYTEDVEERMLQGAPIVIAPSVLGGLSEADLGPGDPKPPDLKQAVSGVSAVSRVSYAQGSLSSDAVTAGLDVMLRGVDPDAGGRFGATAAQLTPGEDGLTSVVLGADLAERLKVEPGDLMRLTVVSLEARGPRFRFRSVRVSDTFRTGFSQFDRTYLLVPGDVLEAIGETARLYEVTLENPRQLEQVRQSAEAYLGDNYLVTDWTRQNPALFTALRLQKWALFLVLGLIVVVSTFNVGSALVVLVRERTRDIGVLAALGLRPRGLERVFLWCALILGAAGVGLGLLFGSIIVWALDTFELIRFDADVAAIYFVYAVPFKLRFMDLVVITLFSLVVILLASFLPARRAARLDPAHALRYE